MKKILTAILLLCLLVLAAGCSKKEEKGAVAAPSVQISYAAYQYEGGYQLSEGWIYDMTISSQSQLDALGKLVNSLKLTVRDELFDHGRGYYLVFKAADGHIERDLLVLDDGMISKDGMLYDANQTDALIQWLNALKIDEQDFE